MKRCNLGLGWQGQGSHGAGNRVPVLLWCAEVHAVGPCTLKLLRVAGTWAATEACGVGDQLGPGCSLRCHNVWQRRDKQPLVSSLMVSRHYTALSPSSLCYFWWLVGWLTPTCAMALSSAMVRSLEKPSSDDITTMDNRNLISHSSPGPMRQAAGGTSLTTLNTPLYPQGHVLHLILQPKGQFIMVLLWSDHLHDLEFRQ